MEGLWRGPKTCACPPIPSFYVHLQAHFTGSSAAAGKQILRVATSFSFLGLQASRRTPKVPPGFRFHVITHIQPVPWVALAWSGAQPPAVAPPLHLGGGRGRGGGGGWGWGCPRGPASAVLIVELKGAQVEWDPTPSPFQEA